MLALHELWTVSASMIQLQVIWASLFVESHIIQFYVFLRVSLIQGHIEALL